jgi:hypothetical protein
MATIAEFGRRLELVNLTQIAGDALQQNESKVRDLNIKQLMAGLNNQGRQLSPKYSEDPYFKKPGAAARYAAWKKKLFPESPFDVPNLIIIGTFHNSITATRQGDQIVFAGSASFAGDIAAKYGNKELGLSPDSKTTAYRDIVRPELITKICQITGAKPGS